METVQPWAVENKSVTLAYSIQKWSIETMLQKKVAVIPFPGGRVELRTAGEYTDKETKEVKQSRAGIFLCIPGTYDIDVSGVDLEALGKVPEIIRKNKLAQLIIKINEEAALSME